MSRIALKRIDKPIGCIPLAAAAQEAGVNPADVQELIMQGVLFTGALSRDEFFISPYAIPQLKQLIRDNLGHRYEAAYHSRVVLNKRTTTCRGIA